MYVFFFVVVVVCVCMCGIGDPQHLWSTSNIQAQTFLHMYTPVDPALLATAGSVHSFPPTARPAGASVDTVLSPPLRAQHGTASPAAHSQPSCLTWSL